jgi:hypothetical protein
MCVDSQVAWGPFLSLSSASPFRPGRHDRRGYFDPADVRRYLNEHAEGTVHHHHRLWTLWILELWQRMFIDQRRPVASPPPGASRFVEARISFASVGAHG